DRLAFESYRLYDDVLCLLSSLKDADIRLGLVTNGASDTQRGKLQALGIEPYFTAVVVSGEMGIAKPDPRVFASALAQLGVEPAAACHVGDNLTTDVAGANAAGMVSVWLNRRGVHRRASDPEPDLEIASLSALPDVLQLAAGRSGRPGA